jgi:hypothetical protein
MPVHAGDTAWQDGSDGPPFCSAYCAGADEDGIDLDALYPYTSDRLDWLASHLDRPGYCDEAADDAGGPPGEILAFVAWGMDRELREVFGLVRTRLEEIAEDEDDGDPD